MIRKIKQFKKEYEDFKSKATDLDQNDCYKKFEKVMSSVMESTKTGKHVKNNELNDDNNEDEN